MVEQYCSLHQSKGRTIEIYWRNVWSSFCSMQDADSFERNLSIRTSLLSFSNYECALGWTKKHSSTLRLPQTCYITWIHWVPEANTILLYIVWFFNQENLDEKYNENYLQLIQESWTWIYHLHAMSVFVGLFSWWEYRNFSVVLYRLRIWSFEQADGMVWVHPFSLGFQDLTSTHHTVSVHNQLFQYTKSQPVSGKKREIWKFLFFKQFYSYINWISAFIKS